MLDRTVERHRDRHRGGVGRGPSLVVRWSQTSAAASASHAAPRVGRQAGRRDGGDV